MLYPKIIKYEIYELDISSSNITINDFEFLRKSDNLRIIEIWGYIYYSDVTKVPLEDIFSYVPNVYSFTNLYCFISSKTMTKLFLLKRNVKFSFLDLAGISDLLDPHLFVDYIKQMFDFDDQSQCPNPMIVLAGNTNILEELYDLFKPWRKRTKYSCRTLTVL